MSGQLVTQLTRDFKSTIANCIYNEQTLGGTPIPTNIVVNGQPLLLIADTHVCSPVPPINTSGLGIPPCPAGTRTITAKDYKVEIEGMKPVLESDETLLLESSSRMLTGPYLSSRIVVGTQL